jgi:hypothetical protein
VVWDKVNMPLDGAVGLKGRYWKDQEVWKQYRHGNRFEDYDSRRD